VETAVAFIAYNDLIVVVVHSAKLTLEKEKKQSKTM
jgi:hypothetical protein